MSKPDRPHEQATRLPPTPSLDTDLWLEEVHGERALTWVREQNARTLAHLHAFPEFSQLKKAALSLLEAQDKIAYGTIRGGFVYNLWQDQIHPLGLWRRATLASYTSGSAVWEHLLDVDALAEREGKHYVLKTWEGLRPTYDRWLLGLSEGGSDAAHVREFDLPSKSFVANGFVLPASKSRLSWLSHEVVLLADARDEAATTASGYPLRIKAWRRATPPDAAAMIHSAAVTDVAVQSFTCFDGTREHVFIEQAETFFTSQFFYYDGTSLTRLQLPTHVMIKGVFKDQLLFVNREPLRAFKPGSLLTASLAELLRGELNPRSIFSPHPRQALEQVAVGKEFVYLCLLDDVRSRLLRWALTDSEWTAVPLPLPTTGTINLISAAQDSDQILLSYEDFLTPPTLYVLNGQSTTKAQIQQLPSRFDSSPFEIRQAFATSSDGANIPYSMVCHRDLPPSSNHPTLLYGYGGFEISLRPSYLGIAGGLWLERGGTYVLANIRGGGEFGPTWHQAALKAHRQLAFDDFAAVAKALISTGVTSPQHLGIQGGSNGGLLVGATVTQHPKLFNAVLCQVPLLDMLRYHKLLAGASWMAEYGDPDDPDQAAYLERYSPLHNLRAEVRYPEIFFMTSTKDDRVHPGHARKMAARMGELGHPFLYFEKMEGGHSVSADLAQMAENYALAYTYLGRKLGLIP